MATNETPVYIFTGFLESGKTKFITETLEDSRFAIKENTLLLVCEQGEEEYDEAALDKKNISVEYIEELKYLTPYNLGKLQRKHKSARVMIEYNGVWQLTELFEAMPEGWMIVQEIMLADANTFEIYNANMRSLTVDKLNTCEVCIFTKTPENVDKDAYHKIIRGISRSAAISYVYPDGHVEYDETVDPLPFDTDSDHVIIADRDYALWYRDMTEEPEKYEGKTVTFKGIAATDPKFPPRTFAVGRHVMVCCAEDITYRPVVAVFDASNDNGVKNRDWINVSGIFKFESNPLYDGNSPVLHITALTPADPPEDEVATFY